MGRDGFAEGKACHYNHRVSSIPLCQSIERHFIDWTESDWPADWPLRFGRRAPLGLELGFGNGAFLEELAAHRPETDWVAGEISWASVRRLLRRLDRRGLANVRVFQGNGAFVLEHLFAPDSLDTIYINHPDPWPKVRHHGRRLIQPAFVDLLARRLAPGGRVLIVTDHADYAGWIAEVLEGQRALSSVYPTTWVSEIPGRTVTKYEQKGVEAGSIIHYFVWARTGSGAGEPARLERLPYMPNVMLEGSTRGAELLPGFRGRTWREEHQGIPVLIRFLAVFQAEGRDRWLVETRVQEGAFSQHLMLLVESREGGRLLVKPSTIGAPRPTRAVKRAVRHLAALLLEAHPGLRVHASSVGDPARPEDPDPPEELEPEETDPDE